MFRVEFLRPFDILLKYKALQRSKDNVKEDIRKGRTSMKPERPVMSDVLNEVRTFFEGEGKNS